MQHIWREFLRMQADKKAHYAGCMDSLHEQDSEHADKSMELLCGKGEEGTAGGSRNSQQASHNRILPRQEQKPLQRIRELRVPWAEAQERKNYGSPNLHVPDAEENRKISLTS